MVVGVSENGFAGATVMSVCARAKVSRRTFYEEFDSREACFLAVLDHGYRQASTLILQAFDDARQSRDEEDADLGGLRGAMAALLSFFDAQPRLARVLLVESLAAGAWALERRERHVGALTRLIVGSVEAPADVESHPLRAAGVMASVLGIVQTHLVTRRPGSLVTLLGPLMDAVAAPYLGARVAVAEVKRGEALARKILAERDSPSPQVGREDLQVPSLLCDVRAHRARNCLRYLAEHPGASNRQVGTAVGIGRDSHISTLLARLRRIGLLVRSPGSPGGPNAWTLSPYGREVARVLHTSKTAHESCVKS